MIIRLKNYTDYIGRTGIKNPLWFCMDVAFLTRTEHFEKLTKDSVVFFVYFVGECLKAKSAELEVSIRHASLYCMMNAEEIGQAIEVLENVQLLSIESARHDRNLCTEGKGREEEGREDIPASQDTLPLPKPQDLEPEQARVYDRDHESVNQKPKATELPRLALIWNLRKHPSLPEVKMCSAQRRRHAVNRWKEQPTEEFWVEVIERVNASDFCMGKVPAKDGRAPWKANFDWLCRPDSAARVMEGRYDNPRGPGGSSPSTKSYWARQQEQGDHNGQ